MSQNHPVVLRPVAGRSTQILRRPRTPSMPSSLLPPVPKLAMNVFWLMIAINFLNYFDRFLFAGLGPVLKIDFHLDNAQIGLVASAFLLVYTVAGLPVGLIADRRSRTRVIAIGVGIWSLATWYTAIAHTFTELFLGRMVLGIGEAIIPVCVALLAVYFSAESHARVLSRWGVSTLIGTAVGYIAGGMIAQHFGWRWAFFISGPPGLVLAWLVWHLPDRRAYDTADLRHNQTSALPQVAAVGSSLATYWQQMRGVLRSRTVRIAIVIQALGLFIVTPAVLFVPIYLREHFTLNTQSTNLLAALVLLPGGVVGTLLGGYVADILSKRYAGGRMLTVMLGFACGMPFFVAAFLAHSLMLLLSLAFVATVFMNMFNGPLNAIVQEVIPGALRASGSAVVLTLAHLMGDVASPTFIGWLSNASGHHISHYLIRLNIGQALVACGGPVLLLAAVISFIGVRVYVREASATAQAQLSLGTPQLAGIPVLE